MTNYNYLLVEANQIKVGGYNYVSSDFVNELVNNIYAESEVNKNKILAFIKSNYQVPKSVGNVYLPFSFSKSYLTDTKLYKASTKTSKFVSYVYNMSELDNSYRELAFIMFALRLVDPIEYLSQEDVSYVIENISCDYKSDCIVVTISHYTRIMLAFIQNVSRGVDYGICPWDFVYHITKSVKNRNVKRVYKTIARELANGDKLEDYTALNISSPVILEKYIEEIVIMTPILVRVGYIDRKMLMVILREINKKKYRVEYMQFILNNSVIFDLLNSDGLKWEFAN